MESRGRSPRVGAQVLHCHRHRVILSGIHRVGDRLGDEDGVIRRRKHIHRHAWSDGAEDIHALADHPPLEIIRAGIRRSAHRENETRVLARRHRGRQRHAGDAPRRVVLRILRGQLVHGSRRPRIGPDILHDHRHIVGLPHQHLRRNGLRHERRAIARRPHVDRQPRRLFAEHLHRLLDHPPLKIILPGLRRRRDGEGKSHIVAGEHKVRQKPTRQPPSRVVRRIVRGQPMLLLDRPGVRSRVPHRDRDTVTLAGRHHCRDRLADKRRGIAPDLYQHRHAQGRVAKIPAPAAEHPPLHVERVVLERRFHPEVERRRLARRHRVGQTHPVGAPVRVVGRAL